MTQKTKWLAALALPVLCGVGATRALAQSLAPGERPSDRPLEVPGPGVEPPSPLTLPPLPPPREADRDRPSAGRRVLVSAFRVTGSTVFSPETFDMALAPWTGREIASEELLAARDAVTLLYVQRGYVNSGAIIPDQKIEAGVVELRVVEGRLADVEIGGNRWFRTGFLRRRIEHGIDTPLDANALAARLERLQEDPRFARLNAELVPGARPGEALLRVRVEERPPWHLAFETDNYVAPSIGAYQGQVFASFDNVIGWGDTVAASFAGTAGLRDVEASYSIPVTPWDTSLALRYRRSTSDVVEHPFDELDISGRTQTYGVEIAQPVWSARGVSAGLSLAAEHRSSDTFLFGDPFSFTPGIEDGRTRITVLRFAQDFTWRDATQVLAARSMLSFGLHAADQPDEDALDAHFFVWLGQLQYVRRFESLLGTELVVRADAQLTPNALYPIEQFSLGGATSVRGYRENEVVRDQGALASIEARIPVFHSAGDRVRIQLAPFVDCGRSWSAGGNTFGQQWLSSIGIGLRGSFLQRIDAEIYWAARLNDVEEPEDWDLQDSGVQFRVTVAVF